MSQSSARVVPSWISSIIFRAKASLLQVNRAASDLTTGIRRFSKSNCEGFDTLIAEARSFLWKVEDTGETSLQLGKVQNLRCAVREINGIMVPAGGIFSFWRQVGKTNTRKGYTIGRELREGCLIPSVGGGLCQLSNTLYDAVLKARFQVIERHAHSKVIPGSAAAEGRDATVFWNYVDFRFAPSCSLYIEAFLTREELVIRFLGNESCSTAEQEASSQLVVLTQKKSPASHTVNNCFDCGVEACFRHSSRPSNVRDVTRTAFVLDEHWLEYDDYLARAYKSKDIICIPLNGVRWNKSNYAWNLPSDCQLHTAEWETIVRAFQTRRLGEYGARRLQAQLESAEAIASHFGKRLPSEADRICVSQTLLPYLWNGGYLGGRTFDVLMTRQPLHALHEKLELAAETWPEHSTLSEYRAPEWIVRAEKAALDAADHIITPHSDIQSMFKHKTVAVPWHMPAPQSVSRGRSVLFPGPTAARKGAFELREVARELDLEILLTGKELEGDKFWLGIRTKHVNYPSLAAIGTVVQPALLEDRPRTLLRAIACGLPVIATRACGLSNFPEVRHVEFGNKSDLKEAITATLYSE